MSVVQRLRCDGCNAERSWWLEVDKYPAQIPEGWFSLIESDCDPRHFCGRECLFAWANRNRPVEHHRVPMVAS